MDNQLFLPHSVGVSVLSEEDSRKRPREIASGKFGVRIWSRLSLLSKTVSFVALCISMSGCITNHIDLCESGKYTQCVGYINNGKAPPIANPSNCWWGNGASQDGEVWYVVNRSTNDLRVGVIDQAMPLTTGPSVPAQTTWWTVVGNGQSYLSCGLTSIGGALYYHRYATLCASTTLTSDCVATTVTQLSSQAIGAVSGSPKRTTTSQSCVDVCRNSPWLCHKFPVPTSNSSASGMDRYSTLLKILSNDHSFPLRENQLDTTLGLNPKQVCRRGGNTYLDSGNIINSGSTCTVYLGSFETGGGGTTSAYLSVPTFLELTRSVKDGRLSLVTTDRSFKPTLLLDDPILNRVWGGAVHSVVATDQAATLQVTNAGGHSTCIEFVRSH